MGIIKLPHPNWLDNPNFSSYKTPRTWLYLSQPRQYKKKYIESNLRRPHSKAGNFPYPEFVSRNWNLQGNLPWFWQNHSSLPAIATF